MRYAIVINGCSVRWMNQLEEIYCFISNKWSDKNMPHRILDGCILFFYDDEEALENAKSYLFTSQVIFIKIKFYLPEVVLKAITDIWEEGILKGTELFLFSSEKSGNEIAVRLAFRMEGSSIVGADGIEIDNDGCKVVKPVYSNYMEGEFLLEKAPFCISINQVGSIDIPNSQNHSLKIMELDKTHLSEDFIICREFKEEKAVKGLEKEDFILVAGRGVKSKDKTEALHGIAHALGAEFGVTRPVAMNAWSNMETLIGVSGAMTKPKLCITAGVSGAAAFYAGIEKADYIIAIDQDERASIHKACNISIIDDYEAVLMALMDIVRGETE